MLRRDARRCPEDGTQACCANARAYVLAWNPMAIVHNHELRFADGHAGTARVWAHDESSWVDCRFDDAGDLVEITSLARVRDGDGPQPRSARFLAYDTFEDVRIPVLAEVSWDGPGERVVYWRGQITGFDWR